MSTILPEFLDPETSKTLVAAELTLRDESEEEEEEEEEEEIEDDEEELEEDEDGYSE